MRTLEEVAKDHFEKALDELLLESLERDSWIQNAMKVYAIGELEAVLMYKKEFPNKVYIEKQ